MGLLTDPHSSNKLFDALMRHYLWLSWIFYIAGLSGVFVMVHPLFSAKTYFSENALLPGLVHGEFNAGKEANSIFEELKYEYERYQDGVPFPYIEAKLRQAGIEVYTHNFSLKSPLTSEESTTLFKGRNVYGILRAPRASSTESLVMSVPYRHPLSFEEGTQGSLALLLTMASFFRKKNYWAKDIIFLITEHEQLGMQAWLEAYHQTTSGVNGVLLHGDLPARAGAIQAAINMEIKGNSVSHLNVKIVGLNGQLPNLDLFNLVNRLCMREEVKQMFQGVEDHPRLGTKKGYLRSLSTFMSMILKQSTGIPSGNHGLFHQFGIEALTIEGITSNINAQKSKRHHRRDVDFYTLGRIIEGTFRSLNNLLERFHQSFFFYLLPSSNRYVSIGMYMPFMGFLGGSIVLFALGLWFESYKEKKKDALSEVMQPRPNLIPYLPLAIFSYTTGISFFLPKPSCIFGFKYLSLSTENSTLISLTGFCLATPFIPILFRKSLLDQIAQWRVLKSFILIQLSTLAFSVSLCNFSLAYLLTFFYVPVALISGPSKTKIRRFLNIVLCLLVHPLFLLFAFCTLDTWLKSDWIWDYQTNIFKIIGHSFQATKSSLVYAVIDQYIYGSVSYGIATGFLLPCWTQLWSLNFIAVSDEKIKKE